MDPTPLLLGASLVYNIGSNLIGGSRQKRQERKRRGKLQDAYDKFSTDISDDLRAQTDIDYYKPEIGMDIDNMKLNLNQSARENKSVMDANESRSGMSSGFINSNRNQFDRGLEARENSSLRGIYDKYFQETERAQGVIDDIEQRNQELYYRTIV